MSEGISAQGTIIRRNGVEIAELRDITPPAKTRNPIELTNQNDEDDSYTVGIRRSGEMTFNTNYLPDNPTHDGVSGFEQSLDDGSRDFWEVEFPDGTTSGTKWQFSGYVIGIAPSAPVDDRLSADVTIRPTGRRMTISAV